MQTYTISIIGAGNVGTHLANILYQKGHSIQEIFSRKIEKAQVLADSCGASATNNLSQIKQGADFYLIAVKDDAIDLVSNSLPLLEDAIVAHTSGTVSINELKKHKAHGSFYPLQTFTLDRQPNWETLPICITTEDAATQTKLVQLAQSICNKIYYVKDEQKPHLHLGAVMVNNFINHLLGMVDTICKQQNLSPDILQPLLIETIEKAQIYPPFDIQTGPARRSDWETINKHLSLLENKAHIAIYEAITQSIISNYGQSSRTL